jgi:hypothetical protein
MATYGALAMDYESSTPQHVAVPVAKADAGPVDYRPVGIEDAAHAAVLLSELLRTP